MPSARINGPTVTVATYDAIGADGGRRGFLRHIGLAASAGAQDRASVIVLDMGPPLRIGAKMKADAVGTAGLTEGEARKIKAFIDRHEGEHRAVAKLSRSNASQIYCIVPPSIPFKEEDGRSVRERFSCAGFVFEAYKRSRIRLVDDEHLPLIDLEHIKQAYPDFAAFLDRADFRASMGLTGTGPWPVMLCGYLLNALKRPEAQLRETAYSAQPGDEIFV
jgi:hypothetical protein